MPAGIILLGIGIGITISIITCKIKIIKHLISINEKRKKIENDYFNEININDIKKKKKMF